MKIFINTNTSKPEAINVREKLLQYCKNNEILITKYPHEADFIIAIGGDGTFISSAQMVRTENIPILGINTGTLGYLTDIMPEETIPAINTLKEGSYDIEKRMMLNGNIIRNGEIIKSNTALNEISVVRNTLGIMRFEVYVNNKLINTYSADGLIVCTPTGSTAYSLSCGGPIIEPSAEMITITPIAPHTMMNRSLVISSESTVEIKITELRESNIAYMLNDGKPTEIVLNDSIIVKKSEYDTKMVKLKSKGFLDLIRERMI